MKVVASFLTTTHWWLCGGGGSLVQGDLSGKPTECQKGYLRSRLCLRGKVSCLKRRQPAASNIVKVRDFLHGMLLHCYPLACR